MSGFLRHALQATAVIIFCGACNDSSGTKRSSDTRGSDDIKKLSSSHSQAIPNTPEALIEGIRSLDSEKRTLAEQNRRIRFFLGEEQRSCALSLPIHTLKIALRGIIDGDAKRTIHEAAHHQDQDGVLHSRVNLYLGESSFDSLSLSARAYRAFAQPYITTWEPLYRVADIQRIKVVQEGPLFEGKPWTLDHFTLTATEKDIVIWEQKNLNITFQDGHAWEIDGQALKSNAAYRSMLEHKNCSL